MNVSLVEKEHRRSWLSDQSSGGRHDGLWGEETTGRKVRALPKRRFTSSKCGTTTEYLFVVISMKF